MLKKWCGIASVFFLILFMVAATGMAATAELSSKTPEAGGNVHIKGKIAPGQELYVVICSEKLFKGADSPGEKEKSKLVKKFGDAAIPPSYYMLTSAPQNLATPTMADKGQTSGIFAWPPFKWTMEVNKIKKWGDVPADVQKMLGPINAENQWKFLIFTHEKKFGINTVSKERPVGGGNARMVMSGDTSKDWNAGVSVDLKKDTGEYSASFTLGKRIPPNTPMSVYVNGEKVSTLSVQKSGFYFTTGGTYMNPLVVLIGAFLIGCMFVIVGAAGGLFTAAFQITVVGTNGMVGVNAANAVKPTNLFLTLCSPITGVYSYLKEGRLAWPVAIFFVAGILIGAFWIGPTYSAKYLPMKAYKFWLGFICLLIGLKLWWESTKKSIEKKKAIKAIVQKFNEELKKAKAEGRAAELGKVEIEGGWTPTRINFSFWGEAFKANPIFLFFGGVIIGCIAAAFGVGGGFMLVPFMTTIMGYPMHLAVPISLCGTFGTSIGGIARYMLNGYSPDWIMAALIAAGAMAGGKVGPMIQKKLPEIFLKRALAGILVIVFLKYTNLLPFLR